MKERKKEEKKQIVEREGVVDEGEVWRRGERDGISFMREIAMKPGIKFKYPNFDVSYIIYNNYYFFINKKIQIIKINYKNQELKISSIKNKIKNYINKNKNTSYQ